MTEIAQACGLEKTFTIAGQPAVEVLQGVGLSLHYRETVAITGPSGSGKSTLLALLGGLDRPTAGTVHILNQDIGAMSENALSRFRAQHIGIVFQRFHLMPHLNALENVSLPLEILKSERTRQKALEALDGVQMSHRARHFPSQLSGGEMQRVAIARAFVTRPSLLLADEPTGSVDQRTGERIIDLLFEHIATIGMTILMITHNADLARRCQRVLSIQDGVLNEDAPAI